MAQQLRAYTAHVEAQGSAPNTPTEWVSLL